MADSGLHSLFAFRLRGEADIAQSVVNVGLQPRHASLVYGRPQQQLRQLGEVHC